MTIRIVSIRIITSGLKLTCLHFFLFKTIEKKDMSQAHTNDTKKCYSIQLYIYDIIFKLFNDIIIQMYNLSQQYKDFAHKKIIKAKISIY